MPVERKSFTGTEIRAGLFVLLSAVALLLFIGSILRVRVPRDMKTFHVAMTDIGGLDRAADVRFGGMIVGRVSDIGPDPEDHTRMIITAKVRERTPVNAGSVAYAGQITLTSEKHLEITTGTAGAPLLEDGASIPGTVGGGMFGDLTKLTTAAEALLADLQLLLGVTDSDGRTIFVDDQSRTVADLFNSLDDTLQDMRALLGVVDEQGNSIPDSERKTLSEIMGNLDLAVQEGQALLTSTREVLDENRESIAEVLESAKRVANSSDELVTNLDDILEQNRESIDKTLAGAGEAVEKVTELMVHLQDLVISLEVVMERNGPEFEEMLVTLNKTLRNLEELTRMLADQPQSIIRGREPVGRQ
jgi:phospholipid/cholesterol/gamma-HCH transport system substrate-binding protein